MGFWEGDRWRWNLKWRRRWFEWERNLIDDVELSVEIHKEVGDASWWEPEPNGTYSVQLAYKTLHDIHSISHEQSMFSLRLLLGAPSKPSNYVKLHNCSL